MKLQLTKGQLINIISEAWYAGLSHLSREEQNYVADLRREITTLYDVLDQALDDDDLVAVRNIRNELGELHREYDILVNQLQQWEAPVEGN